MNDKALYKKMKDYIQKENDKIEKNTEIPRSIQINDNVLFFPKHYYSIPFRPHVIFGSMFILYAILRSIIIYSLYARGFTNRHLFFSSFIHMEIPVTLLIFGAAIYFIFYFKYYEHSVHFYADLDKKTFVHVKEYKLDDNFNPIKKPEKTFFHMHDISNLQLIYGNFKRGTKGHIKYDIVFKLYFVMKHNNEKHFIFNLFCDRDNKVVAKKLTDEIKEAASIMNLPLQISKSYNPFIGANPQGYWVLAALFSFVIIFL